MEINQLPLPAVTVQLRTLLEQAQLAAAQMLPPPLREADPALDRQAALLDRSFFRLLRLASNLSLADRLSAPLSFTDVDIVDLVGDICDRAGSLARFSGQQLRFLCVPERRLCALVPDATEQLLYHLLSNAMKASVSGATVTVQLRFAAGRVLLSVEDNGCGIPEEPLAALISRSLSLPPPHGTGLGLVLCQRIARCQGGVLMAESRRGKGSRFTFSLPDRRCGKTAEHLPLDFTGGFNPTLVALADALPPEAFLIRSQG